MNLINDVNCDIKTDLKIILLFLPVNKVALSILHVNLVLYLMLKMPNGVEGCQHNSIRFNNAFNIGPVLRLNVLRLVPDTD